MTTASHHTPSSQLLREAKLVEVTPSTEHIGENGVIPVGGLSAPSSGSGEGQGFCVWGCGHEGTRQTQSVPRGNREQDVRVSEAELVLNSGRGNDGVTRISALSCPRSPKEGEGRVLQIQNLRNNQTGFHFIQGRLLHKIRT